MWLELYKLDLELHICVHLLVRTNSAKNKLPDPIEDRGQTDRVRPTVGHAYFHSSRAACQATHFHAALFGSS